MGERSTTDAAHLRGEMAAADPPTLDRFTLREELGRGGMGRVIAAQDPQLQRAVAVKVLLDANSARPELVARFRDEARLTSQLQHPNIVPVHELGTTEDGRAFFVMKKVDGRSLREVISALRAGDREAARAWTVHRRLSAFVQVCQAVAYAHSQGIIHRDLKPDNVMVGAFGEVLLMDWGIARRLASAEPAHRAPARSHATTAGSVVGTRGYMSPEQARGALEQLGPHSDIWSLGAILFELIALEPLYAPSGALAFARSPGLAPSRDLRRRRPDQRVPPGLAQIVLQATEHDPAQRTASASALAQAVEDVLSGARRRTLADQELQRAPALWAELRAQEERWAALAAEWRQRKHTLRRWLPLEHPDKQAFYEAQRALRAAKRAWSDAFGRLISLGERALAQAPDHPPARDLLADAYWHAFRRAEASGNAQETVYYEERVRTYGARRYRAQLRGTNTLRLRTAPPGAAVHCQRVVREGVTWTRSAPWLLGHTPLTDETLPLGSYVLTLRSPGRADATYPLTISRLRRWEGETVPLLPPGQIPPGFAYVPAGPCILGGDPDAMQARPHERAWVGGFLMSILPVTVAEYAAFLSALHARDPALAWARAPRETGTTSTDTGRHWPRPAPGQPYRPPFVDKEGDTWAPDWPVCGISWDDARAYSAWWSRQRGLPARLPTEPEWEKAARGADGRFFPWGDDFDATLCWMARSERSGQRPMPVGHVPTDCSVYGVRDLAGTIREWCAEEHFGDNPNLRPVRGGSWSSSQRISRAANRYGYEPHSTRTNVGMRLAIPLTEQTP